MKSSHAKSTRISALDAIARIVLASWGTDPQFAIEQRSPSTALSLVQLP